MSAIYFVNFLIIYSMAVGPLDELTIFGISKIEDYFLTEENTTHDIVTIYGMNNLDEGIKSKLEFELGKDRITFEEVEDCRVTSSNGKLSIVYSENNFKENKIRFDFRSGIKKVFGWIDIDYSFENGKVEIGKAQIVSTVME